MIAFIKVRGQWLYLYRAIDSAGETWNFISARNINCRRASTSSERRWTVVAGPSASSWWEPDQP
ncbi:MAG: DDE domain-containing protein [Mesorhizobium sp.]|nr:MAG: DDE domain-containing protein [Mesorhizobium sp.]RWX59085.1 DDE domain-containing protein [Mesorhizobium sp. M2A.F.Ca.ET.039.01.1.1]